MGTTTTLTQPPLPDMRSLDSLSLAVATGRLFHMLADLRLVQGRRLCPWLQLVRTHDLERWAFGAGVELLQAHLRAGDPTYHPLVERLLERHLRNLAVRRRPRALIDFCRRLPLGAAAELAELWERADLPGAMAPPGIREQEATFAERLEWVADKLQPLLPWAAAAVRRVADGRTPANVEADGPCVRVVFATTGGDLLQDGALVRFVLLAERNGLGDLVNDPTVFDATFMRALDEVILRVGGQRFRTMQHQWNFLPNGALRDTSGFLPIWTAQSMAMGVNPLDGRCWGLPAWVVVSGSVASDGSGVAPAGLLSRKCSHLIHEGVRVLLVVDEETWKGPPLRLSTARAEGVDLPGADELLVVRFRGSVEDAIAILNERAWTWPVRAPASTRPFAAVDPRRTRTRIPRDGPASDYQRPDFVLDQIQGALGRLDGRGYLHAQAAGAWGKSALAAFLERDPEVARRFGLVVRYRILHGVFEKPAVFINRVCSQFQSKLAEEAELPLFSLGDMPGADAARERLADLLRLTVEFAPARRLLLVIDGLDELTEASGSAAGLLGILPATQTLAPGCFVLLLSRPTLRPGVAAALGRLGSDPALFGVLHLNADIPRGAEEEHERPYPYWELMRRFAAEKLKDPSGQLRDSVARHLPTILERSAGNFLHLRLLCELLRGLDLDVVPPGQRPDLGRAIADYLDRVAAQVQGGPDAFREWHRPLLLLTTAATEAVSRASLRRWLGRSWDVAAEDNFDRALDELVEFALLAAENRSDLPDDTLFSIGHEELADWLRSTDDPRWRGALDSEGRARISVC
jgi:hypothetical protein